MADSVAEKIATTLKTRLGLISTGSGYETTVSSVIRPTRLGGFHPDDYQIILNQGDIVKNDELSHPGNPPAQAWNYPFEIIGILRPSETSTLAIDKFKNTFWADIVKAITTSADSTPWHTFGSQAINSTIGQVTDYRTDDGGEGGFQVDLLVTFRTDETNPYNVRA